MNIPQPSIRPEDCTLVGGNFEALIAAVEGGTPDRVRPYKDQEKEMLEGAKHAWKNCVAMWDDDRPEPVAAVVGVATWDNGQERGYRYQFAVRNAIVCADGTVGVEAYTMFSDQPTFGGREMDKDGQQAFLRGTRDADCPDHTDPEEAQFWRSAAELK